MGVRIETGRDISRADKLAGFDYVLAACGVKGLMGGAKPADIPGLIVIGDGHYGKTTSVVECIADGKRAAEAILNMPVSVDTELAADEEVVYSQRGQLIMAPEAMLSVKSAPKSVPTGPIWPYRCRDSCTGRLSISMPSAMNAGTAGRSVPGRAHRIKTN